MKKNILLAEEFTNKFRFDDTLDDNGVVIPQGLKPGEYYIVKYDTICMLYYAINKSLYLTLAAGTLAELTSSSFNFNFPLGEITSSSSSNYLTIGTTKIKLGATTLSLEGLKSLNFNRTTTLDLDTLGKLKVNKSIYSYEDVSAFGQNNPDDDGLLNNIWDYTHIGDPFLDSDVMSTFNAYTIGRLASRITTLESGSLLNIINDPNSAGNAFNRFIKSGNSITFYKDYNFLTVESDPVFTLSPAHSITNDDVTLIHELSTDNLTLLNSLSVVDGFLMLSGEVVGPKLVGEDQLSTDNPLNVFLPDDYNYTFNAYTIQGLHNRITSIEDITQYLSIVNSKMQVSIDFYSTGDLSAYGNSGSSNLGILDNVWDSSHLTDTFFDTDLTSTFNSYTVKYLYTEILALKAGSSLEISTTGAGNAITSVTKTNNTITFNKGLSFSESNHVHPFSSLTFTPTTLLGYGITDAVNITTFEEYINSGAFLTQAQKDVLAHLFYTPTILHADVPFYSTDDITAFGSGEGEGPIGYDRLDLWTDYIEGTTNDWVLSAYLGYDLHTRLGSLTTSYNSHVANKSNPHEVTKAQINLGNVENIALSTWIGSTNITRLGVIVAGTWNASPIENIYLAHSDITIGTTTISLGSSSTTLEGLTRVTMVNGGYSVYNEVDSNGYLKFSGNIYSVDDVSAFGFSSSGSNGLVETVYDYYRLGDTFDNTIVTDTFNAFTIANINSRVVTLENGSAINFTTTGTGNALTGFTKTGNSVVFIKDKMFSESGHLHYKTDIVDFPTLLSQFENDLGNYGGYLTTISDYVKNDLLYSTSNTTYALSAYQGYLLNRADISSIDLTTSTFTITLKDGSTKFVSIPTWNQNTTGSAATLTTSRNFSITGSTGLTASVISFNGSQDVALSLSGTLGIGYGGTGKTTITLDKMWYASSLNTLSEVSTTSYGRGLLSSLTDTLITGLYAAKSDILATTRTIWGQNFNGSTNVSGSLSDVTNILLSGYLQVSTGKFAWDSSNSMFYTIGSDNSSPIGFYSTGDLSAYGNSGSSNLGILDNVWDSSHLTDTFFDTNVNNTFNAYTIKLINDRFSNYTTTEWVNQHFAILSHTHSVFDNTVSFDRSINLYSKKQLTGTVSIIENSNTVTGVNTLFLTELSIGNYINIGGTTYSVSSIESNTSLTLTYSGDDTLSGQTAYRSFMNLITGYDYNGSVKFNVTYTGNVTCNDLTLHNATGSFYTTDGSRFFSPTTNGVAALELDELINWSGINYDNIRDVSTLAPTESGTAFCSFDVSVKATSNNGTFDYNHLSSYQDRMIIQTAGNIPYLRGFWSWPQIEVNNMSVTTRIGFLADDFHVGSSTGYSVTNNYGVYVSELNVGTNKWAVYTAGSTPSYFGGSIYEGGNSLSSKYASINGDLAENFSVRKLYALSDDTITGSLIDIWVEHMAMLDNIIYATDGNLDLFKVDRYGNITTAGDISASSFTEYGVALSSKYAAIADKFPGFGTSGTTAAYGNHTHSIYAALAGNSSQAFSASQINTSSINGGSSGILVTTTEFDPYDDNTVSLGAGDYRWSTVYAGTGSINTSDAREKTMVMPLNTDEINAAIQLGQEIGSFQFLSSLVKKGTDARWHIGMTVQRAIEILRKNNLNPSKYGFICYDDWGTGDRYSFRTDELLLFITRGLISKLT